MTHLNAGEFIDAMEGLLPADRQAHLAACDACRRQQAELASALGDARQVTIPEPSPLFWQHFSQRVRVAIDAAPARGLDWPRLAWLRFAVVPSLALLVMALVFALPRPDRPTTSATLTNAGVVEVPAADDNWVMMTTLVGDLDWETARAAGVAPGTGAVDLAVLALTPEEQQELTRLLEAELMRAKS